MKETERYSPLIEKLKQNENYAVWFGLKGPDNEPFGEIILKKIITNPVYNEAIFTGLPGIGKTTLLEQLRMILEEDEVQKEMMKSRGIDNQKKIEITPVFLDDALKNFEEIMNLVPNQRAKWKPGLCQQFSNFVSNFIDERKKEGSFLLIELIPRKRYFTHNDGDIEEMDILFSTFQKEIVNPGTLVFGIAADPRVQAIAASIRSFASQINQEIKDGKIIRPEDIAINSDIDDYEWLTQVYICFGVKFVWEFRKKPDDPTEAAKELIKLLLMSARKETIRSISNEAQNFVSSYVREERASRKSYSNPNENFIVDHFGIDDYGSLEEIKDELNELGIYSEYQKNIFYIFKFLIEIASQIPKELKNDFKMEEIDERFFTLLNICKKNKVVFIL